MILDLGSVEASLLPVRRIASKGFELVPKLLLLKLRIGSELLEHDDIVSQVLELGKHRIL